MVSRRLYEILGIACGFVLIDYGFSFFAAGFPGARALTSQLLGGNLLIGGSVAVFVSLYYLLKPASVAAPAGTAPVSTRPDLGVETIVEEQTPPQSGFYRNIEYVGYFFTILGLFSAADLVLQVFLRSTYNEGRWWVEILLVIFGVLSYTIFGSVGRIGSQEEAKLAGPLTQPKLSPDTLPLGSTPATPNTYLPESLEIKVEEFTRSTGEEFERHLSSRIYDMFRLEKGGVTIWREDRQGIRSIYLAGPYELSRKMLEQGAEAGELKIGSLNLSVESMRALLALIEQQPDTLNPVSN